MDSRFYALRQNFLYYIWLLNIDGFDYSSFESNWLLEYGTKPYFKRFSKSEVLIDSANKTSLITNYLLNSNWQLKIIKNIQMQEKKKYLSK